MCSPACSQIQVIFMQSETEEVGEESTKKILPWISIICLQFPAVCCHRCNFIAPSISWHKGRSPFSLCSLKFQRQLLYLNRAPIFITVKHLTSFWLIGALAAGDRVPRQQNSLPVQHLQAAHTCNVNMKFKHHKSLDSNWLKYIQCYQSFYRFIISLKVVIVLETIIRLY